MINKNNKKSAPPSSAGFTIIETLTAVLVLSIAIAGSITLASRGLTAITTARQEVSATYLAQDAMEYIRATRDSNCLATNNGSGCPQNVWLGNMGTLCSAATGCTIDTLAGVVSACTNACSVLNYDSTNTVFTYASANGGSIVPSAFTRTVYIQNPVGGNQDEASTTIVVSWPGGGDIVRSVRLHEDLLNWQ